MHLFRHIILPVLLFLFFFCAKQGFPPGGPADKTSPRIVQTTPRPDTTRVALNSPIELEFSEPVERRSCEESIFITPLPAEGVQYNWKGNKLAIHFPKGLLANRTYVITVGVGCKDRRNNPLTSSWSLAFSTGERLDQGSISGQLFSEPVVEDAQIWAYDLAETANPNPALLTPLYITQPDIDGQFHLRHLSLSCFRVFAVQDRDRNSRYNAQSEAIAVASQDIQLSANHLSRTELLFRMAVRDTTAPRLAAATATDRNHLDLQFSEKLADAGRITILSEQDTLHVLDHFLDFYNPAFLHLSTQDQVPDRVYTVSVSRSIDLAGHSVDSLYQKTFKGSNLADTTKPKYVAMVPRDSSRAVPWDSAIRVWFSKAMNPNTLLQHFSVQDTSKKKIPGKISFPSANQLLFTPENALTENRMYQIKLPVDSIKDAAGNRLADTLFVKNIKTVAGDTLSEISGTISDQDSLARGRIFVQARSTTGKEYPLWLESPGDYRFKNIMPGSYILYTFRDQDDNGLFSLGDPFPFQPSERFTVYPDTLTVRSRWPNEGNDILIINP